MPFDKYMRPGMGLVVLHIPLQRFAICISLSIYNYYRLFPKSPEDVSWRYFVVVRGKTTIKAVWANLSRLGGVITLLGLITPGLACSVLQVPLTRFIAICFTWVIKEILVGEICSCGYGCNYVFVYGIVIAVYPHNAATNQFTPMFADYSLDMFAFLYHLLSLSLRGRAAGPWGSACLPRRHGSRC